jgi:hypothetical protein
MSVPSRDLAITFVDDLIDEHDFEFSEPERLLLIALLDKQLAEVDTIAYDAGSADGYDDGYADGCADTDGSF